MPKFVPLYQLDIPDIIDEMAGLEELVGSTNQETFEARSKYLATIVKRLEAKCRRLSKKHSPLQYARLSELRIHWAENIGFLGDWDEAIAQGKTAIREALGSGYHHAIHKSYRKVGYWEWWRGNNDAAAEHFLNALTYAFQIDARVSDNHNAILVALGEIWANDGTTLPLALMTTQWRLLIDNHCISAWVDHFKWKVKYNHLAQVEEILKLADVNTFAARAKYCAALLATADFGKATSVLEEGMASADATGDVRWQIEYEMQLERARRLIKE